MKAGERLKSSPEKVLVCPTPPTFSALTEKDFPDDLDLLPGMVFSFVDAQNAELAGIIKRFADNEVMVDFNHPLSGRHLEFERNSSRQSTRGRVVMDVKLANPRGFCAGG